MRMLVLCMFILSYMPLTLDDEFIARSRTLGEILVPSIEDLIILRLMGGKDKDIEDVKRLLRLPNLDIGYLVRRARDAGVDKDLIKGCQEGWFEA